MVQPRKSKLSAPASKRRILSQAIIENSDDSEIDDIVQPAITETTSTQRTRAKAGKPSTARSTQQSQSKGQHSQSKERGTEECRTNPLSTKAQENSRRQSQRRAAVFEEHVEDLFFDGEEGDDDDVAFVHHTIPEEKESEDDINDDDMLENAFNSIRNGIETQMKPSPLLERDSIERTFNKPRRHEDNTSGKGVARAKSAIRIDPAKIRSQSNVDMSTNPPDGPVNKNKTRADVPVTTKRKSQPAKPTTTKPPLKKPSDVAVIARPQSSLNYSFRSTEFPQSVPRKYTTTRILSQSQSNAATSAQKVNAQKNQNTTSESQKDTRKRRREEDDNSDVGDVSEDEEALEARVIAERRAGGKKAKASAQPGAHSKNLRLTKHGPAGDEVYEVLMTSVCAQLVRTRKIDPDAQIAIINDVLGQCDLLKKPKIVRASISSVSDWVSNKSCRLRKHFVNLGSPVSQASLTEGQAYKQNHPDENYEHPTAFPKASMLASMVSKENIADWLMHVRSRVDIPACLDNPKLRKELLRVYIGGYRYGIKAAWSHPFEKTYFQSAIESLDKYTQDFVDIPVRPFDRRTNMKRNRVLDLHLVDPDMDELEGLEVSGGEGELYYDDDNNNDGSINGV